MLCTIKKPKHRDSAFINKLLLSDFQSLQPIQLTHLIQNSCKILFYYFFRQMGEEGKEKSNGHVNSSFVQAENKPGETKV